MEIFVGVAIEALVAVLLMATIFYCATLDRRLKKLRSDETAMRDTITELVAATHGAERAIAALRATVVQSEETLTDRLGRATAMSHQMAGQLGEGEEVIGRITKIAKAARDHAHRESSTDEIERVQAAHEAMRIDARRQAGLEAQARAAAATAQTEPPLSASAAAAAAAERFATRIRALSLGAAT